MNLAASEETHVGMHTEIAADDRFHFSEPVWVVAPEGMRLLGPHCPFPEGIHAGKGVGEVLGHASARLGAGQRQLGRDHGILASERLALQQRRERVALRVVERDWFRQLWQRR